MFRKFQSLASPNHGFAYDSEAWSTAQRGNVEAVFRMFDTYGDGLIQHSPHWSVTTEHIADF